MSSCDPAYRIEFYNSAGQRVDIPAQASSLQWGRKLDNISRCTISYVAANEQCCTALGALEPLAWRVAIIRDDVLEWYGWITEIDYARDSVQISCADALWWLTRRIIHNDLSWKSIDLTTVFLDLWNDAMEPSDIGIEVITTPSGVLESRESKVEDYRYTWNVVQEMLDSGLDVFAYATTVFAGVPTTFRPIELSLNEIQGGAVVTKAGSQYANRIVFDANEDVNTVYPPGNAIPADGYPLVEEVIKDSQVNDIASAENRAKARYEYSKYVPRIVKTNDGIVLPPNSPLKLTDLVPGVALTVDTTGLCYSARETFRIGSVDVNVQAGTEIITMGLQPSGPATNLNSAETIT